MRESMLIAPPVLCGLASFALQASTLFQSSGSRPFPVWPFALALGLLWFALAVVAARRLQRRRWWAFVPAPLVLMTPLGLIWLLAACSVTRCDF